MTAWAARVVLDPKRKRRLWEEMASGREGVGGVRLSAEVEAELATVLRLPATTASRWGERIGEEWRAELLTVHGRDGVQVEVVHYTPTEVREALTRLEEMPAQGRPWNLDDVRQVLRRVRTELIAAIAERAPAGRQLAARAMPHADDEAAILAHRAEAAKRAREIVEMLTDKLAMKKAS